MGVVGIEHVQLAMPVGGEDLARSFYRDLLGIPERTKPPQLVVRGGCWFEGLGIKLHLGVEVNFHPAQKAHPALLVDDLAAMIALFVAAGIAVTPDEPLAGRLRCYVVDPFGNRIELIQI